MARLVSPLLRLCPAIPEQYSLSLSEATLNNTVQELIGYRILKSGSQVEDLMQEAYFVIFYCHVLIYQYSVNLS